MQTLANTITQDGKVAGTTKYIKIYQNLVGTPKIREVWSPPTTGLTALPANHPLGLQLGINGQIYVAMPPDAGGQTGTVLGAIELPELPAPGCNFNPASLNLVTGTSHSGSLPQWVQRVPPNIWPKVYNAVEIAGGVTVDNNGNVICSMDLNNMANNINHNGPIIPNTPDGYFLHYNKTNGITNWVSPSVPGSPFTMSSGDIQFNDISQGSATYKNATSGVTVPGPNYVPSNQKIIAEDNGVFITAYINHVFTPLIDQLWVHTPSGIHNVINLPQHPPNPWYYIIGLDRIIFNPATKTLFAGFTYQPYGINHNPPQHFLATYQLFSVCKKTPTIFYHPIFQPQK